MGRLVMSLLLALALPAGCGRPESAFGRREISRERTTIDGRDAVRMESETTGDGLHPPGIRSYEYFVDLGGSTVIAVTYDAGNLPFEHKRRVLDAMMSTFDLHEVD